MADRKGWCPVPNEILDRLLPNLRDTELRVLLAVCRATLGRRDSVSLKRRRRDWISHAQLTRRTGRGGAAVSRALGSLVEAGYLRAESEEGRKLPTARERRAHRGRIYLSLSDALWNSVTDRQEGAAPAGVPDPRGPRHPKRPLFAVAVRRGWERAGRVRALSR